MTTTAADSFSNYGGNVHYTVYSPSNNVPLGKTSTPEGILTYNDHYTLVTIPTTPLLSGNPYLRLRSRRIDVPGAQYFEEFATVVCSMTMRATLSTRNGNSTLTVTAQSCSNSYTSITPSQKYYMFEFTFQGNDTVSAPFEVRVPVFHGREMITVPATLVAQLQRGQTPNTLSRALLLTGGRCGTPNQVSAAQDVVILFSLVSSSIKKYVPYFTPVPSINANQIFQTFTNNNVLIRNQCGLAYLSIPCANSNYTNATPGQVLFGGSATT